MVNSLHAVDNFRPIPCRPLLVVGKGAALSQADTALRQLVDATGLPFLATAMGRGVVPDGHPGAVNAARSAALRGVDVALIIGARCKCLPFIACIEAAHLLVSSTAL